MRSVLKTYYKYLEGIQPLLGNNIFKLDPVYMTLDQKKECYYFKLQEYYGRIDKLYLTQGINSHSLEIAAKYTKDMLRHLVLSQNYLKEDCYTNLLILDVFSVAVQNNLLSESLFQRIKNISKGIYRYNEIESVKRTIYNTYLKLLNT